MLACLWVVVSRVFSSAWGCKGRFSLRSSAPCPHAVPRRPLAGSRAGDAPSGRYAVRARGCRPLHPEADLLIGPSRRSSAIQGSADPGVLVHPPGCLYLPSPVSAWMPNRPAHGGSSRTRTRRRPSDRSVPSGGPKFPGRSSTWVSSACSWSWRWAPSSSDDAASGRLYFRSPRSHGRCSPVRPSERAAHDRDQRREPTPSIPRASGCSTSTIRSTRSNSTTDDANDPGRCP